MSLIPVRSSDLVVGKPLVRGVYDRQGKLLLAAGCVIETHSQLKGLAENGFVQEWNWDPARSQRKDPLLTAVSRKTPPPKEEPDENAKDREIVVDMDDVRWCVGETLHLQLVDNQAIRYVVRLIGFVKGKMLFVTAPMADGKLEFIREGQAFVVRAFAGKKAYAFAALTVKLMHTPHPYLQLSYPREVRCTVVRRGARAPVKLDASFSLDQSEKVAVATLTDLSIGGASGTLKEVIGAKGVEGRIKFTVHSSGHEEQLNLKAVLRSVAAADNGEGFKHGFEFLDISLHDRLILSAFVHQTIAEGD